MGRYAWGDCKPTATMLAVVVVFAVLNTLTKMAFNQGMRITVLITLRQFTAFLFLAPIAYFRERYGNNSILFVFESNKVGMDFSLKFFEVLISDASMYVGRQGLS